jgi:hypothetical protein
MTRQSGSSSGRNLNQLTKATSEGGNPSRTRYEYIIKEKVWDVKPWVPTARKHMGIVMIAIAT